MSKKTEAVFTLLDMSMDSAGNIDMGGRIIDNAGVMQAETMSVGTAESNIAMSWDGECLSMNATDGTGMVRMSGLADPKDGCDAATKDYVDRLAEHLTDEVMAKVMQRLQSGTAVKF